MSVSDRKTRGHKWARRTYVGAILHSCLIDEKTLMHSTTQGTCEREREASKQSLVVSHLQMKDSIRTRQQNEKFFSPTRRIISDAPADVKFNRKSILR